MIKPGSSTIRFLTGGQNPDNSLADINFAIPAERVMALLEKPIIAMYPTEIPFSERDSDSDFEIELLPNASLSENPEVTLHLGETGEERRSFLPETCRRHMLPGR